ncbi:unnamed protein product [Arctia plantaginis]|uniref:FP protein N-terminal domain-containing protein n=1 Tax=Arctia plantaginis TaxID=874455 RepID=A0A8S1BNM8_ARCPL|nr:unnamed protein product [Arctia plantaginis]
MVQCKKCKLFLSLAKEDIVRCKGECENVYHKKCANKKFLNSTLCDDCQTNKSSPKQFVDETKITLNPREESGENVLAEVNKKLAVIYNLEKKIEELTNSVEFYADMYQTLLNFKEESQKKMKTLEQKNVYLEKCNKALEERVQELEMKDKEKNIEIHGLEKHENENTKLVVQKMAQKLNLDPNDIEEAQRVGQEKPDDTKPKTVLVTLRETRRGGGILIYAKNALNFEAKMINTEAVETIHGQLKHGKNKTHIIAIYRPPANNKLIFIKELENLLQSVPASDSVIVIGDTNINILNDTINPTVSRYKNALCECGLLCVIPSEEATREAIAGDRLEASCLDHIWVRAGRSGRDACAYVLESRIADHHGIGIMLNLSVIGSENQCVNDNFNNNNSMREVLKDKIVKQKLDEYDWAQLNTITCPVLLYQTMCSVFNRIYKESTIKTKIDNKKVIRQPYTDIYNVIAKGLFI